MSDISLIVSHLYDCYFIGHVLQCLGLNVVLHVCFVCVCVCVLCVCECVCVVVRSKIRKEMKSRFLQKRKNEKTNEVARVQFHQDFTSSFCTRRFTLILLADGVEQWFSTFFNSRHTKHKNNFGGTIIPNHFWKRPRKRALIFKLRTKSPYFNKRVVKVR